MSRNLQDNLSSDFKFYFSCDHIRETDRRILDEVDAVFDAAFPAEAGETVPEIVLPATTSPADNSAHPDPVGNRIAPQLRALIEASRDTHLNDAKRNGRKAKANKERLRAEYAAKILEAEGREVRSYRKSTPDRRQAQVTEAQANRRSKMTDEERKAESAKRTARRHAAKERKAQEEVERIAALAIV